MIGSCNHLHGSWIVALDIPLRSDVEVDRISRIAQRLFAEALTYFCDVAGR
jgi:hypothetical protein